MDPRIRIHTKMPWIRHTALSQPGRKMTILLQETSIYCFYCSCSQFCGSRSAWIRIDLTVLDPDPYCECGSGSRSMEIDQNSKINIVGFMSLQKGFCRYGTFGGMFFLPITYLRYIFHLKIQLFVGCYGFRSGRPKNVRGGIRIWNAAVFTFEYPSSSPLSWLANNYDLVLDDELPIAPVGPLWEYRPLVVLHTSIWLHLSSSIMWEGSVPLCVSCICA